MRLECRSLCKSYGGVHALLDVGINFPESGVVAVIGPNGAGKTTLLNVLTGFLRADGGTVVAQGRNIGNWTPRRIARLGIARTFQDVRLIRQMSVLDNMLLARPSQKGERLLGALTRVGVTEEERGHRAAAVAQLEFVGLAEKAAELAGTLSYGQQKLLTLGCCLATGARVLLLDEPVAGVHPNVARKILSLLAELGQEHLIVFVEHDISAVKEIAGRVIVMDDGRVIADGSPGDVLRRPEILEAYVG